MAVLGAAARARIVATWMRENKTPVTFDKAALAAAVATTDEWIETQMGPFNSSLPITFRSSATAEQKAEIFAYVLWRRIGRLRAAEDD